MSKFTTMFGYPCKTWHDDCMQVHYYFDFVNGFSVSVVQGCMSYCDDRTYEVALKQGDGLVYCRLTDYDVLGYQTPAQVKKFLKTVSGFSKGAELA